MNALTNNCSKFVVYVNHFFIHLKKSVLSQVELPSKMPDRIGVDTILYK